MNSFPDPNGDAQTRAIGQRLRNLPGGFQPPYDWAEYQRRAAERHNSNAVNSWRYAAVAAGFAVLVAGVAIWSRFGFMDRDHPVWIFHTEMAATQEVPRRSIQAENSVRWLESLPSEPVVVRVGTRLAVEDLEDRIACVDDLLTAERLDGAQSQQVMMLQRERERLLHSLVQVRYAETLAAELP